MLNWIRGFWAANHAQILKIGVPAVLALVVVFSFFTCSGSSTAANGYPTSVGGFTALLVAAGLFFVGFKLAGNQKASSWLVAIGIFMVVLWAIPKFLTAFTAVTKLEFGMVALILIGLILWIRKSGSGWLGWRVIVVAILLASMLGSGAGIVVKGLKEFSDGIGISVPSGIKNGLSAANDWLDAKAGRGKILSQREKAQSRLMYVRKGIELIFDCPSGGCSYSWQGQDDFVQVILVGEPFLHKDVTFQEVRLPRNGGFADGVNAFVNVADLLTEGEAFGVEAETFDDESEASKINLPKSVIGFFAKYWLVLLVVGLVIFLLRKLVPKELGIGMLRVAFAAIVVWFLVFVGYTVYRDIQGPSLSMNQLEPPTALSLPNADVVERIVPPRPEKGYINKVDIGRCKYRSVVITEEVTVVSASNQPVLLHFGANNKGIATFHVNSYRTNTWKGLKTSIPGANYVTLQAGTEIRFPNDEDPVVWVSMELGKTGELAFYRPTSKKPILFAYKEL